MGFDPKNMAAILREQQIKARGGARAQDAPIPTNPAAQREIIAGTVILKGPKLNKAEQAFMAHLAMLERMGRIKYPAAVAMKLRLAHDKWYWPDATCVRTSTGRRVVIEVKGHLRDDARDKFKQAIALFPDFDFLMFRREQGGKAWECIMRSEGALDL